MTNELQYESLVEKLESLSADVDRLRTRLEAVEASLADGASARGGVQVRRAGDEPEAVAAAPGKPLLGGVSEVFARLAWVCFLLVVALMLRTLAASEWLSLGLGIWTGVGYALALTLVGWVSLARGSRRGGTCTVTGVLLLCSVIVEATFRHQMLSGPQAYSLLLLVAAGSVWGARAAPGGLVLWVNALALLTMGTALLFVTPHFALLAVLALTLNAAAGRQPGTRLSGVALRAAVWLGLVVVWCSWALELSGAARGGAAPPAGLYPGWFGPLLLVSFLYFVLAAAAEACRLRAGWLDAFDTCMLPLNIAWAHVLAVWIVLPPAGGRIWLGIVELAIAMLLVGACEWTARRRAEGQSGSGVLAVSAAAGLYLAVLLLAGDTSVGVLVWACAAAVVAVLSRRWNSGGARVASYLLVSAGAVTGFFGAPRLPAALGIAAGVGPLLAAAVAGAQYRWLRRNPPPPRSHFFRRIDRGDSLRVLVLLAAVVLALRALQDFVRPVLAALTSDPANAATCTLTVCINLAALALLIVGQRRGDTEVRGLGVFLMVVGAGKVFLYDLLAAAGLPLVGSVLSFGVAAGLGATVLRKRTGAAEGSSTVQARRAAGSGEDLE